MKFYLFQPNEDARRNHVLEGEINVNNSDYELVFIQERLTDKIDPEDDFYLYYSDTDKPSNYYGVSISIGDILVYITDTKCECYYCNTIGFEKINNFINEDNIIKIINNIDVKEEYYTLLNDPLKNKERLLFLKEEYLLPISLASIRALGNRSQVYLSKIHEYFKESSLIDEISEQIGDKFYLKSSFIKDYQTEDSLYSLFNVNKIYDTILKTYACILYKEMSSKEKKKFKKNKLKESFIYDNIYVNNIIEELINKEK